MEFGNIGQHCSFSMCHQQDFLPFECDGCKKIFCTAHARADDHQCRLPSDYDSNYVIICPICEARIKMKAMDDPNQIWNAHSASGKCQPKDGGAASGKPAKKCMAEKCYARLTDVNSVTCNKCFKEVCLRHRFEDGHQCTNIVRNTQTAKSKLLQPGYFKEQQVQSQQNGSNSMLSQTDYSQLEANINKFSNPVPQVPTSSAVVPSQAEKYQPERCEVCGTLFLDVNKLIEHTDQHFKQFSAEVSKPKTETEKCPHCPKRFALTELVNHLQQDHFIY